MSSVALITGITGQDGSYLAEFLLEKNYKVWGIIRRSSHINTQRIDHLYINQNLVLRYGDLSDSANLLHIMSEIKNTYTDLERLEVYNLGAMSHVKVSFEMPEYTGNIDGLGVLRLLEAIRSAGLANIAKFYQASTSELYGKVLEVPQKETTQFNPLSPYATAKMYGFYIVKNYRESYGMFCCNGILFNHGSPRRGETFLERKVSRGLGMILRGERDRLVVGNLNSLRDLGHAGDYIKGMWMMMQQEKADDFVLSTGEYHSVREIIEIAFGMRGFEIKWKGEGLDEIGYDVKTGRELIFVSEKYFRPNEVDELLGDSTKARTVLGWKPEYSFYELIREMVDADCPFIS